MPIAVSPEVIKAVGPNAGIAYAQIDYWLNKANNGNSRFEVHKGDKRWVAKSREDLCHETGLTAKQLRTSIERLLKEGLIERERHLFNGKVTAHFRVTTGQADLGDMTQTDLVDTGQIDQAPTGQTDQAHMGQIIYIETVLETKEEIIGGCASQTSLGELEMVSKKSNYSVSDMLAGHSASKKVEKVAPENSKKPGQLSSVFKQAYIESYPDLFVAAFTSKELGQFGLFAKRCSPHNAGSIIDHCVRDWGSFKSRAVSDEAAINPPSLPSISFLLRFVTSAVNLYRDDTAPTKPVQAKNAPNPHKPPSKPAEALHEPPTAKEPFVTIEEVHKLLGLDDDYVITDPAEIAKLIGYD